MSTSNTADERRLQSRMSRQQDKTMMDAMAVEAAASQMALVGLEPQRDGSQRDDPSQRPPHRALLRDLLPPRPRRPLLAVPARLPGPRPPHRPDAARQDRPHLLPRSPHLQDDAAK
ncbi:hypothetical protein LY76DRAFT_685226, partial [Colletotrichum caudatum]